MERKPDNRKPDNRKSLKFTPDCIKKYTKAHLDYNVILFDETGEKMFFQDFVEHVIDKYLEE